MKLLFLITALFASINCSGQNAISKSDTLLKIEHVTLLLENGGFAIPPFGVSGDIYLTNDLFIFHPKPFRRQKVEMYNNLIRDIELPYDSILVAKRVLIDGLKIKTKAKKYKIGGGHLKPRSTIALINRLRKGHAAK
jgi:hypothetical protein